MIWGVLNEDTYETAFGDGLFLHLRAIALAEADAQRLVDMASADPAYAWHVRPYHLGLLDGLPKMQTSWPRNEEFTLDDVVAILLEIAPDGTSSEVLTGSGAEGCKPGPHMLPLA